MEQYFKIVENKLKNAKSLCLITDLWVTTDQRDFMALGVGLINNCFEREVLVINMMRVESDHSAETLKKSIEEMVNVYQFDKSKIVTVDTDQGSNLVRLFAQIQNINFADLFDQEPINVVDNNEDLADEFVVDHEPDEIDLEIREISQEVFALSINDNAIRTQTLEDELILEDKELDSTEIDIIRCYRKIFFF